MELFVCSGCVREFDNYESFRKHLSSTHKIKSEETFIKYKCNGIKPTCGCGCGGETKFLGDNKGYRNFISGHNSSTSNNNFHKNPDSKIKSAKTQSENWKLGLYRRWWDEDTEETKEKIEGIKEKLRNNIERGKKISRSLTGVPKSDEHKRNNSISAKQRYVDNPQLLIDARKRRIIWLKRKQKNSSKLEGKFKSILDIIGLNENIDYEFQYEYNNRLFDFYLINNNVLIEVDGDFYHCNPNTIHSTPKYKTQILTVTNDLFKNKICQDNHIPLIRFWEKDINERPEWIITELKKILNNQNTL